LKRGLRRGEAFLKDREFSKASVSDYLRQSSATKAINDNPFVEFTSIHIHTANICTASCVFCPYSQHIDKKSVMDLEVFKKIIDEYVQLGGDRIYFSPNAGDPLVDVTLPEKAEYARSLGIKYIGMITNGILLNRKDLYKKLMPLVDNIGISLPGLDRDAYKRLFGVDKASTVENNLMLMANEKKDKGLNTEILLLFRIDRPFQDVMQDDGMQNIKPFIDDGTIKIDLDDILTEVDDWCGQIKESNLPGLMTLEKRKHNDKIEPCSRLYSDLAILPDGTAKICACRYLKTHYDDLVIGDLKHSTIDKTFFGTEHKKILEDVCEGRWPEVCKTCNFYTPIKS
jgi:pyruvate-formate lyase-activating enzyme